MTRTTIILSVSALVASMLLASCGGGPGRRGSYSSTSSWGNYKCTAVQSKALKSGRSYLGWSTSQSGARSNALSKCSAHGGSCIITGCAGSS